MYRPLAAPQTSAMDVAVADELAIGDPVFVDQVRGVLRRHGVEWRLARTQVAWCLVAPAELDVPAQGWKLHVSATPLSAPLVLAGAAEVLVARRCPFKFAATMSVVEELVSPECPRGTSGKFITAYPRDDDQFCLLAEELHAATEHLPGPAILSDRRYRPGSLVHYRYGVLTGVTALGNDGSYQTRLRAPDGTLVRDERNPWFAPPSWARCPLPDEAAPDTSRATSGPVLLDGRFVVREAIQHANKGGVYRAVDKV